MATVASMAATWRANWGLCMPSDFDLNPFAVQSPEHIAANDVLSLFVEDFADFHQIRRTGHTFLHGARGSGKSMIFRILEPDCQMLKKKCALKELDFFAFYVPIKETEVKLTELIRLEKDGHGSLALNEHLMTVNIALKMLTSLQRITHSELVPEEAAASRILSPTHLSVSSSEVAGQAPYPRFQPKDRSSNTAWSRRDFSKTCTLKCRSLCSGSRSAGSSSTRGRCWASWISLSR